MKSFIYKVALIYFVLCSSPFSFLNAQSFERSWQEFFFSIATDVVYSESDDTWIIGGQNGDTQQFSFPTNDAFVRKYDSEGNVLWQTNDIMGGEDGMVKNLLLLPNGDIFIGGEISACDVGSGNTYLAKLSGDGQLLWQQGEFDWRNESFSELHLLGDNQIILLENEMISMLDFDGNFIWSNSLENGHYSDPTTMVSLSDGNFLIGGKNFLDVHNRQNGEIIQHQELEGQVLDIVALESGNEYFVFLNNEILHINENLETLTTHSISPYFDELQRTTSLSSNAIGILGKKDDSWRVLVVDEDFTLLNNFALENKEYTATSLSGTLESLAVVGYVPSYFTPADFPFALDSEGSRSSFINVFPTLSNPNTLSTDVGIESFNYSTVELLPYGECLGIPFPTKKIVFTDLQLTFKNYGSESIDNLQVNFKSTDFCSSICGRNFTFFQKLENLNLESESTYTLTLDDFTIPNKAGSSKYDICFWTSIPNQRIDSNTSNNIFCETVVFTNIEEKSPLSYFNVYPNPSHDKFTIEATSLQNNNQKLQLQLMDMQGRILHQTYFLQSFEMDLSGYPSGVYLLKVSDGFDSSTQKLFRY